MEEKLNNVSDMIDVAIKKSRRLKEGVLKSEWGKIVGKICNECQPDYIKDKILYVRAESPIFIHHLTLEKSRYIKIVNSYFDEHIIDDIVIKSGKLDENREAYLAKPEKKEKKDEDIKNEEIEVVKNPNIFATGDLNNRILDKITHLQKMAAQREKYLLKNGFKKCKSCGMLYEGEDAFCKVCIDNGSAKKFLKANKSHENEES